MPTIEIVSLERKSSIRIPVGKYPFRVWQNGKLVSHRCLFNDFLSEKKGIILHLANLECVKSGFWFASNIYDHDFEAYDEVNDCTVRFKFGSEYIEGVKNLLFRAWKLSPVNVAYLLTDYQFGKELKGFTKLSTLEELWLLHDGQGLEWNTLYEIN